jgi:integrase/recombinase XerD
MLGSFLTYKIIKMKHQFSVSTIWDSRAANAKGDSRVMLCVSINRERFKLSLKVHCTKGDYDKAMSGRSLSTSQKVLRTDINAFVMKAEGTLKRLNEPTKETFTRFFKSDTNLSNGSKVNAYTLFESKRKAYIDNGQFGTAHTIRAAWYSLRSFRKELFLEDLDESWLKSYQSFLMKKGCSTSTCGIYLRNLRAIYNLAINDGLISGIAKPFKNIQVHSAAKSKSVLYPAQLKKLWEYRSDNELEQKAIAYFFFCYLGNGMNFKDMAHLKYRNIQGDVISFVRQKTKRTKSNGTEIRVHLHDAMKKIIEMWGNRSTKPDDHIFCFMKKYRSEKHFDDTIFRIKRNANKKLSAIGVELGFEGVHLCINLARHSFATKQKLDGTPVAFISDAMGHSSMAVTEHYLKSIPTPMLEQMNSRLLAF